MRVEHFLPAYHFGDAISDSTLAFHRYLLARGIESRVISLTMDANVEETATLFKDYREDPGSLKIMHFAIPSPLTDYFEKARGKKIMIYHNITPPQFFTDYSPFFVQFTTLGREHLKRLAGCFDLAIGVSQFNTNELIELGFTKTMVFPLLINLDKYQADSNPLLAEILHDERRNILFVGRIVPNKKMEDLIKTVFFYKKYLSPAIRLIIMGNTRSLPAYFQAVKDLAGRFYLTADDVHFTGHLPWDEFITVYRHADLFLSMSEHEGFCLPLIESCHFQLPILAYDTGAARETLHDAGILFREKHVANIAALAEYMISNEPLRRELKTRCQKRIASFRQEADPEKLLQIIKNI